MITVTQVPAVFYTMEGQRLNLLLPETLGSTINGPHNLRGENYMLTVSAEYPSEILVYRPNPATPIKVNDSPVSVTVMDYAGSTFVKINVPEGDSVVKVGNAIGPDFEPDGDVDFVDFARLGLCWRSEPADPDCDISDPADNKIDWLDMLVLAEGWLR